MADEHDNIAIAMRHIKEAEAALKALVRERTEATANSPERLALNPTIEAARKALSAAEINLRKIYEQRNDD